MFLKKCRIFLLSAIVLTLSIPASAASFTLPGDAVVEIGDFPFPETSVQNTDRSLSADFHSQLVTAIRQAGFALPNAETDVVIQKQPEADATLIVSPLTDGRETDTFAEETEKTDDTNQYEMENQTLSDYSESSTELDNDHQELEEIPAPNAPTYILTGNITLFQENVGAPTRIADNIRIRTEASMHCAYQVKEAVSGKVIISDVASASAARLTSRIQDIDMILPALTDKVLATVAGKIAERLSGIKISNDDDVSDQSYYQDSPGKRLKPKDVIK